MIRPVAVAAVTVALGWGIADVDRLAEPGRSDRSGVVLAPHDASAEQPDADWTYSAQGTTVAPAGETIRIEPRVGGLQLLSRPIPVFPGRCYEATFRLAASRGTSIALLSEFANRRIRRVPVAPSRDLSTTRLKFEAPEPRITLALYLDARATPVALGEVAVQPATC